MTDVVSSTPLWEQDRVGMDACIETLDRLVENAARKSGGRLFRERGEGDSHFLVFETAERAIKGAAAIGMDLRRDPKLERIHLRTAVHAGESKFRGDYYGPPVNRCARIRAVANPDQILVSEVVTLLAPESSELSFKPLGSHRLKDLLRPERLFQLIHPSLPRDFPELRSLSSRPHNLPVQLSSFVGREADLAKLGALLRQSRMTTVRGPGGVGKTKLALQAAAECVDRYEDGVWFIDLTWTDRESGVASALCNSLPFGWARDEDSLISAIGDQHMLILLDNCEKFDKECGRLATKLLSACPNLDLLATSRVLLHVRGEKSYLLRGLTAPSDDQIDQAMDFDCVKLFCERTADRKFGLDPQGVSLSEAVRLCKKLDCLPLLIEIAAGATDLLSPAEIINDLDSFMQLALGDAQYKPYAPSLAATIGFSCKLLSPSARELLKRLTVFPATWTLEAAGQVCGFGAVNPEEVLKLAWELWSASLVTAELGIEDHRRFGLLQTTAQVLSVDLRDELPSVLERFSNYFFDVSELCKSMESTGEEAASFKLIENEYPNLEKTLQLLVHRDPGRCLLMAENLRTYWLRSSRIRDGRYWFKRISAAAGLKSIDRVKALSGLSSFYIRLDEMKEAQDALTIAEEALREEGGYEWARIVANQATLWHRLGKLEQAKEAFSTSVEVFRTLGYRSDEALDLINLGVVKMRLGDPLQECAEIFRQSLACAEHIGSPSMQANAYSSLAEVYGLMGNDALALDYCRQSLKLYRTGPWLVQTAWTFVNLADLLSKVGAQDDSALVWHSAQRLARLADIQFSPRQQLILANLESSLQEKVAPEDWKSTQVMVSTQSADEIIAMALESMENNLRG